MPRGFREPGEGERCHAHSSRTGLPCRRWAVKGKKVCQMHGAGTSKRVRTGERKDPGLVNIKHGRYSRFYDRILKQVEDYRTDPANWEYDRMMALLVGSLERSDNLAEMAREALVYVAQKAQEDGGAEAAALVITAASTAGSTEALRQRALQEMVRLIASKHRRDMAAGAVAVPEMMALLRWLASLIIRLVADPKIERPQIADRFLMVVENIALGHGAAVEV